MEIINNFWHLFCHKRNLMGVALILLFVSLEKDESGPCILNAVWSERNAGPAQDYFLGYTSWQFAKIILGEGSFHRLSVSRVPLTVLLFSGCC